MNLIEKANPINALISSVFVVIIGSLFSILMSGEMSLEGARLYFQTNSLKSVLFFVGFFLIKCYLNYQKHQKENQP